MHHLRLATCNLQLNLRPSCGRLNLPWPKTDSARACAQNETGLDWPRVLPRKLAGGRCRAAWWRATPNCLCATPPSLLSQVREPKIPIPTARTSVNHRCCCIKESPRLEPSPLLSSPSDAVRLKLALIKAETLSEALPFTPVVKWSHQRHFRFDRRATQGLWEPIISARIDSQRNDSPHPCCFSPTRPLLTSVDQLRKSNIHGNG